MNNYIGIDISINSTAIFIISNKGENILSFTNKKDNNIYIRELDACGVKIFSNNREKSDKYSENEILKLESHINLSENIIVEILNYIDKKEKTYCQIEGYSFSKNTSSILDIVSLSTLVRRNLYKEIKNIDITIISPTSLKLEACKLVYKPVDIGKKKSKLKYVNNEGISGGSFKKPQMFRAMIEGNIMTPISKMLNDYKHLMDREKIPNPIEDIIDSIFACLIRKKTVEDAIR
jgi:hypothetical protein